jgi:DNA primase
VKRPCLDCGVLAEGSRCATHERARQRARNAQRPWYAGDWRRIAKEAIAAHPYCARCRTRGTAANPLTVDHVEPRSLAAGVQVLCLSCNAKKGGAPR